MNAARKLLLERAESYSRDARSLRETGDPAFADMHLVYTTIAEELRRTADLLDGES